MDEGCNDCSLGQMALLFFPNILPCDRSEPSPCLHLSLHLPLPCFLGARLLVLSTLLCTLESGLLRC